ncbi:DUF58 domain-containing protein [Pseudomarimonas salicorniae]|uniref:DUF58 domain-containing protein n=1 Tax=Pseudomarimonas salicorniae TaxID=2933270 RepID=A0ABT0GJM1_9GAMM|nr:DUF58 domain-containing protein [Lysobacter sp. CAU 1642]MCK7594210.1 DUF58 domain-containing protein [Lysobacter sp. CAU 1642]
MATDPALLPAELRAQLRGLALRGRRPPSAGPLGLNASRRRGAGLEFSQHRGYEPGDEPRRIDWKLFARSDRYFVRESESEAALAVFVLLDASASLGEEDADGGSKWQRARELAAAIIELATRQNDRFGLVLAGDGRLQPGPLGSGPRHRDRCLGRLLEAQPAGLWPDEGALESLFGLIPRESVVVQIGDGFEPIAERLACRLSAADRDLRHVALSTGIECGFGLRGSLRLQDPETGAEIALDADSARADFTRRFREARQAQAARLAAAGAMHVEHRIDQPAIVALRALLGGGSR